jgi:tryptophanyl-tRNA synthetase
MQPTALDLDKARSRLDQIDQLIIHLIAERMQLSIQLTLDKLARGIAIVQPAREESLLAQRTVRAEELGVEPEFIHKLFRSLIDESCRVQREVWMTTGTKQRILTGMRPTGALHLGHYVGALETWLELQSEYECFFLIADYQALGTHLDNPELIRDSVNQVAIDWLAVGLDPNMSSFVIQSYIPEHAELTLLLSMIWTLPMLYRNPTLKTEIAAMHGVTEDKLDADFSVSEANREGLQKREPSVGFFSYPVSQAADILLPKGQLVPVGEDQVTHIEDTRVIARRFNRQYKCNVFPIPEARVGRVGRLLGLQGDAKMGKSARNAIFLRDDKDTVHKLVMSMYTDPSRKSAADPGHTEGNPVFSYLDAFDPDTSGVADLKAQYQKGGVPDVDVKERLASVLNTMLDPIRERRAYYEHTPLLVREALAAGTDRARAIAQETMREVREAMKITRYGE